MNRRILCIWLPHWPIQHLLAGLPEPDGQAVGRSSTPSAIQAGRSFTPPGAHADRDPRAAPRPAQQADGVELRPTGPILLSAPTGRGGGLIVAACCPRAAAMGVRVGMPVAEAQALLLRNRSREEVGGRGWMMSDGGWRRVRGPSSVVRCEDDSWCEATDNGQRTTDNQRPFTTHHSPAQSSTAPCLIAPHDPRACRGALRRLARWCQRFSPYVGLEEADEPESLFLDITGCAHLFGGERGLIEQVIRAFHQRRLCVRTAIADTIGAAWALAHYKEPVRGEGSKVKITDNGPRPTDHGQPLTTHHSPLHLRSLPIEALRLPAETVLSLREFDLRTIEQVEALPRSTLPSRFGAALLMRLDQLSGRRWEMFTPERDAGPIEAGWVFDDPVADRRALETVLGRLIEQVLVRLEARGEGVVRLACWLRAESREARGESRASRAEDEHRTSNGVESRESRVESRMEDERLRRTMSGSRLSTLDSPLTLSLARPTRSLKHLRELARLQLERLALPAAVTAVHLRVTAAAPLETRQLELFAADAGHNRRRYLAVLIERLTSRLGERSVLQPRLVPDFQPEFAARFEPLLGQRTFRFSFSGPERTDGKRRRTSNIEHRTLNIEPRARFRPPNYKAQSTENQPPPSSILHPSSSPLIHDRPLRLLTAPIHVNAASIFPDGPPIRFPWRGREYRVQRWWGPERIETGWWRGPHVRRDYYRVEVTSGERLWLFRERPSGEWYLHGLFE